MAKAPARISKVKLLTPGKLPHHLLRKILAHFDAKNPNVLLGPQVGIDAAVIHLPQKYLAVTSDPITLAGNLAAYYCVHVNANDLAVMGALPEYMTIVGLSPPTPPQTIENIARDLTRFARDLGITIVGGHTEITTAVNTPILVATLFGPLVSKKVISAASAKPGDVLVMTKSAAIESAAIIAREREDVLKKAKFSAATIRKMQNLLFTPGISVLPEAQIALRAGCSAMHDATEGGILTAIWEIAEAAHVRVGIESQRIPVLPEVQQALRIWKIDPLRAISSGTLLITIAQRKLQKLLSGLSAAGIQATVLGEIREGPAEFIDSSTGRCLLPSEDEIVKIYS